MVMKRRPSTKGVTKTPGDFVIMYHNAVELVAQPTDQYMLAEVHSLEEAEKLLRVFREFRNCLKKFPMHPTARLAVGRGYRGRIYQSGEQTWEAWVDHATGHKALLDSYIFQHALKDPKF